MPGNQITYKIIPNVRLNTKEFHGEETHPLYLRVTYNRQTIDLKSRFFDLLQRPKYSLKVNGGIIKPSINEIIEIEKKAIEFIISKNESNSLFSLEHFRTEYQLYTTDIISLLEKGFIEFMITFFEDEGYPVFANIIRYIDNNGSARNLIYDLKSILKPIIYSKLIENAAFYSSPYLPVFDYAASINKKGINILPLYVWTNEKNRVGFEVYLRSNFPGYNLKEVHSYIQSFF